MIAVLVAVTFFGMLGLMRKRPRKIVVVVKRGQR